MDPNWINLNCGCHIFSYEAQNCVIDQITIVASLVENKVLYQFWFQLHKLFQSERNNKSHDYHNWYDSLSVNAKRFFKKGRKNPHIFHYVLVLQLASLLRLSPTLITELQWERRKCWHLFNLLFNVLLFSVWQLLFQNLF